jgi:hypothetical protein
VLKLAAVLEALDEPLLEDEPVFGQVCFVVALEAVVPDAAGAEPEYAGMADTMGVAEVDTLAAFTAW